VICIQVVRSVLDELYDQISSLHGQDADEIIQKEIFDLSEKMRSLYLRNEVDYNNPATRFAYIYSYTTAHADMVYQFIQEEKELQDLFKANTVNVSCLGGGPGSDFLGILKFMALTSVRATKLKCLLCDKERSWREAWYDVDSKIPTTSFSTSTTFWDLDITDTSNLSPQTRLFQADLFTLIYLMSELSSGIEDARDFFDIMVQSAKPGALFLLVENNDRRFYGWFDEFAADAGLECIKKQENYYFVMGWDEQADELAIYNAKFERTPKITASIAYRIYRKP
jgi:hypothetical protein